MNIILHIINFLIQVSVLMLILITSGIDFLISMLLKASIYINDKIQSSKKQSLDGN